MISVEAHSRIVLTTLGLGVLYCLGCVIYWSWGHHGPFATCLGIVGYPFLAFLLIGVIRMANHDE